MFFGTCNHFDLIIKITCSIMITYLVFGFHRELYHETIPLKINGNDYVRHNTVEDGRKITQNGLGEHKVITTEQQFLGVILSFFMYLR